MGNQLHIEFEVHDIAVLHYVILALLAQLARIAAPFLAFVGRVVFEARGLGLDEPALEIRMDGARSLRSLRADRDGPGTYFPRAAREKAL